MYKRTLALPLACVLLLHCQGEDSSGSDPASESGGSSAAGLGGSPDGNGGEGAAGGGQETTGGSGNYGLSVCEIAGRETRPEPDGSPLIDDFDDGDLQHEGNGTIGFWIGNDDGSSGEQSPESPGAANPYAPLSDDGASPGGVGVDGYALHVEGSGYSSWGSAVGVLLAAGSEDVEDQCAFDASQYDGVSFWLKGRVVGKDDGDPAPLTVQILESDIVPREQGGLCDSVNTSCWDSHRMDVTPTDCWQHVSIPFSEVAPAGWGHPPGELDLDQLSSIVFLVAQNVDYDYWIDELAFYSGDPPDDEEICESGAGGAGGESSEL